MAEYESLIHLSRWRRVVIWFCENPVGQSIWAIPLGLLFAAPFFYIGFWWAALIIVAGVAFALGWSAARRRLLRDGRLDKL